MHHSLHIELCFLWGVDWTFSLSGCVKGKRFCFKFFTRLANVNTSFYRISEALRGEFKEIVSLGIIFLKVSFETVRKYIFVSPLPIVLIVEGGWCYTEWTQSCLFVFLMWVLTSSMFVVWNLFSFVNCDI